MEIHIICITEKLKNILYAIGIRYFHKYSKSITFNGKSIEGKVTVHRFLYSYDKSLDSVLFYFTAS